MKLRKGDPTMPEGGSRLIEELKAAHQVEVGHVASMVGHTITAAEWADDHTVRIGLDDGRVFDFESSEWLSVQCKGDS